MAKIKVAGKAIVIESAVSLKDWNAIKKYAPKYLDLLDEDKKKVFSVLLGKSGNGGISDFKGDGYGIQFAPDSTSEFACVTLTPDVPEGVSVEDFVADEYGKVIMLLNKLEAAIPAALKEIEADKKKILEAITIV